MMTSASETPQRKERPEMESKIIQFPAANADKTAAKDPIVERAQFFADYELTELVATIPQADPDEAKFVY
jgi:hypothetical protein